MSLLHLLAAAAAILARLLPKLGKSSKNLAKNAKKADKKATEIEKKKKNSSTCASCATPEARIQNVVEKAKPGRNTKGKTKLFEKDGGFGQTGRDFDKLQPSHVKEISTNSGPGRVGKLEDGTKVIQRPGSSDGRPTLQIIKPSGRQIEIRYNQ